MRKPDNSRATDMLQKIAKVLTTFRRYDNVPCGGPKDDRREAGKFFERAPDEMPYACHRGRRRTTKRSARACACSGACSSPVVVLLPRLLSACSFLRNADFMGFSGRVAIKSSVLYRDEAKNASRCKRQLHFRKFGESKKAIDLLPFDAKTNPRIHPLWRL